MINSTKSENAPSPHQPKKLYNGLEKIGSGNFTNLYVLDASVAVKWVLSGEPYTEEANKLRDALLSGAVQVCAPSLLMHEVANSIWKAAMRRRISTADAHEALHGLDEVQIDLRELSPQQVAEELDIACEFDVTTYDAAYLLLSEKTKAKLVTADDKLYEKAKPHFRVVHLKDYV